MGTVEGTGEDRRAGTPWWKVARRLTQVAVVALVAWVGLRHAQLFRGGPIDAYCPFGAVESLPKLLTDGAFLQKTALSSFVVLGGVLGMSLVGRASFCGWLCPLGAVEDAIHAVGRRAARLLAVVPGLGGPGGRLARWGARRSRRASRLQSPRFRRLDGLLRSLRYVAFGLIVLLTARFGTLVFADYDPFRVLFHFKFETWIAYAVLGGIIVSSVLVERFWCRYLCPVGAVVSVVSRFSPAGIRREQAACVDCGRCDAACALGLEVASVDRVASGQCTLCAECVGACPTDALHVSWGSGPAARRVAGRLRGLGPQALRPVLRPLAAVGLFVVVISGSMAAGAWQTRASGAGSGSEHVGETVGAAQPSAENEAGGGDAEAALPGATMAPEDVKGMMTVDEVAKGFAVPASAVLARPRRAGDGGCVAPASRGGSPVRHGSERLAGVVGRRPLVGKGRRGTFRAGGPHHPDGASSPPPSPHGDGGPAEDRGPGQRPDGRRPGPRRSCLKVVLLPNEEGLVSALDHFDITRSFAVDDLAQALDQRHGLAAGLGDEDAVLLHPSEFFDDLLIVTGPLSRRHGSRYQRVRRFRH